MRFPQCANCLFREDGVTYCQHCERGSQFEPDFDPGTPEDDDLEDRVVIRLVSE